MADDDGRLLGATSLPQVKPWVWPRVFLDGDRLCYGLDPKRPRVGPRGVEPHGMLDRFIRIEDGDDVVAFARRYGVLEICRHRLPSSHVPSGCVPHPSADPLDRWLFWSRQARTLLEIATLLQDEKPGTRELWERTFEEQRGGARWARYELLLQKISRDVEGSRLYLTSLVNEWLRLGNVRLGFVWATERPELPTLSAGTFGLLGVQLALAIARADFRVCDGCGRRYARTGRAPQRGRKNFCPECAETTANKLRQKRLREMDRRILRLLDAGKSWTSIARELGIKSDRVRAAVERGRRKDS